MARQVTPDGQVREAVGRHRQSVPDVETRSGIDTAHGRREVVARWRLDRWAVRAACGAAGSNGLELGVALLAALELCGVDAVDVDR